MKRFLTIVTMMVFSLAIVTNAYASDQEISVLVNGKRVPSDVPPMVVDGTTMLPFRSILNALGVMDDQIVWRAESKSIEIRKDNKYVFLVIGSKGAVVDTSMQMLNVAPFIEQNRTMIPVRFVSEVLGADVKWDNETGTVNIGTKKQ